MIDFTPKELKEYLLFIKEFDNRYLTESDYLKRHIMQCDHYPLWVYAAVACDNSGQYIAYQDDLERHIKAAKKLSRQDQRHQYAILLSFFFAKIISRNERYATNLLSEEWLKKYLVADDALETFHNLNNTIIDSTFFDTFFSKNFSKYDFDVIFDLDDMGTNELYLDVFKDFKSYADDEEAKDTNEKAYILNKQPSTQGSILLVIEFLSRKFASNQNYHIAVIILLILVIFLK